MKVCETKCPKCQTQCSLESGHSGSHCCTNRAQGGCHDGKHGRSCPTCGKGVEVEYNFCTGWGENLLKKHSIIKRHKMPYLTSVWLNEPY